jgi:hypothetical protein
MDGRPFFPLGFYHVSFYGSLEKKLADLKKIAAAGFNLLDFSLDRQDESFVKTAEHLGIFLLPEFNDERFALVRAFRKSPAFFAWAISDDADSGRHTPEKILALHADIKALDPAHLTYISCGAHSAAYTQCADLLAVQVYPVGSSESGPDPLNLVFKMLDEAVRRATPAGRPVIANLQCARIYAGRSAPSAAEIRNMSYQALIAGVQGLVYYTYFDAGWDMASQRELWPELIKLGAELKGLANFWTAGQRQLLSGAGKVRAAQWRQGARQLLALVNTSPVEQAAVDLALENTLGRQAAAEAGWSLHEGRLRGNLEPLEVRLIQFPAEQMAAGTDKEK